MKILLKIILKFLILLQIVPLSLFSQKHPITLIFGGDCTFSDHFAVNVKPQQVSEVFQNIPWMKEADITMVNLECCISTRGTKLEKEFNFRMHPKYLPVFQFGGIDIVNLANNHIVDYGLIGMKDTFHYLDSIGVKYVGAGLDLPSARKPQIIEIHGVRLGFLGYSFAFRAGENSYGTAPIDKKIIKEDLENLKNNLKADYIFVNFHWGNEGKNYPNPEQREIGRFAIDNGADVVVGHHPHVLQGIEEYKSGFIAYSLGNFIFGGNSRKKHYTMLLKVVIENNRLRIEPKPIVVKNFRAYDVSPAERDSILNLVKYKYSNFSEEQ